MINISNSRCNPCTTLEKKELVPISNHLCDSQIIETRIFNTEKLCPCPIKRDPYVPISLIQKETYSCFLNLLKNMVRVKSCTIFPNCKDNL